MKKEPMPTFESFWQALIEAERFGNIAVRTSVENALEKWKNDWAKLAQMADCLICRGTLLNQHNDRELTGTYLLLIQETWDCAENNLPQTAYNDFCVYSPRNQTYFMYLDAAPDILDFQHGRM